ncbi:MAG: STAS domain-containing protein [Candidatus Muiribacteriota bacterium]
MNDRVVLKVGKKLNNVTFQDFREKYSTVSIMNNSIIYLDFSQTANIDSTGISEIIKFNSQMTRKNNVVVLGNLKEQLFKIFKLVNLNKIFPIFKNLDYAFGCESELKHFKKNNSIKIKVIGCDYLLLEVFSHILEAYGYIEPELYINVEDYINKNSDSVTSHILIIEKKIGQKLDDSIIEKIQSTTDHIIVSDILNILDKKFEPERFEDEMYYIFNLVDDKSYDIIFEPHRKKFNSLKSDNNLKKKYEETREFMNEFLHDISSPLNIFLNTKSIFSDLSKEQPELYQAFEISFEKINQMIEEMKLFTQDEGEINFSKINLSSFFNDVISIGQRLCHFENKDFYFDMAEDSLEIEIESSHFYLNHLFINLISNAVKYSYKKVGFETENKRNEILCKFYDDGIKLDKTMYLNSDGINYRNINQTEGMGRGRGIKIIKKIISKLNYKIEIQNLKKGKYIILHIPTQK